MNKNPGPNKIKYNSLIIKYHVHFSLPWLLQNVNPVPSSFVTFLNEDNFYSVRLLDSRLTPKLEDHSWSAVHDCLLNIFAANFHIWRPTPSSANLGMRHPGVTGVHGKILAL